MSDQIKSLIAENKVEQVLKKGSSHKASIQSLQTALYQVGFGKELKWETFGADGDYGNSTALAVKAFAAKNGATVNGDALTKDLAKKLVTQLETVNDLRILKSAIDNNALNRLKKKSPERELVQALQRLLNSTGFGTELQWDRFGADGDFGNSTASAVKAFASKEGLTSSGEEVDELVAAKIMEKFIPFLGEGWAEAKAQKRHHRKKKKGQYFLLWPKGKRNFKTIERERNKLSLEFYKKDPNTGKNINRKYKYEFEKGEHEIPGERLKMEYYEVKKINDSNKRIMSFCYPENHRDNKKKERIVLHFTAGQTLGDIKTITREDFHVSTAYILGRDGTIYRLFSPKQWSYHLGAKKYGHDASSIGIEISNYGPLTEDGMGNLTFGAAGTKFCSLENEKAYLKLEKPFLGHKYYASYTPLQYQGLIVLLRYLTKTFGIERKFLPTDPSLEQAGKWRESPRYAVFKDKAAADNFKGICSHVNYRKDGKWDLGPAFDWDQVIKGVSEEEFKPSLVARTRGMLSMPPLRTEEEMLETTRGMDYGNTDTSIYGPDGPEVDI